MSGFLIEYNRRSGDRRVTVFPGASGSRAALLRRLQLDAERRDPNIEYVTLTGESLEQIEETHSRYFQGREVADVA
ncbi:hypothetical protein [Curtobacterium sp. AB7]|uniref:hypothetical protein n=1 Tax=Curtobacterium sp. AB7 TaxID=3349327 RepID=UPI003837B678